jgi:hypothetical protein
MLHRLLRRCAHLGRSLARALRQRVALATKPAAQGVAVGVLADLVRGRPALVAENAFLRQQLLVLHLCWPFTSSEEILWQSWRQSARILPRTD